MTPIEQLIVSLCAQNFPHALSHTRTGLSPDKTGSFAVSQAANTVALAHSHDLPPRQAKLPVTTHRDPPTTRGPSASLFPKNLDLSDIMNQPHDKAALDLMEDGFAKGTIANYATAINTFTKFCDEHGIEESLRFPADERVLCAFVTSLNKTVSGSTAKSIFSGLRRWHDLHHVKWNGSERIALMIRGVKNNAPAETRRPKRIAITPKMMIDLDASLDHNDPKDCATLACAKTAFFGQARLGELLATSRLKHNPRSHPSRSSVIILLNINAREIQLPKTKTNQANGESIFLTRQSDPLDPVQALENHLRINHGLADSDHLFAFKSPIPRSGRHSLTRRDFLKRINHVWSALGYPRVTGHSFRIGGTTTLLRNGVPPEIVKELGRWSSDAFHEYWRDVPQIVAQHVEFLHLSDTPLNPLTRAETVSQARRSRRFAPYQNMRDPRQG